MIAYDVAIPAFNAEKSIGLLLSEITALSDRPRKILIINDGSTDKTEQICREFDVEVITNQSNKGKGFSLQRAFTYFLNRKDSAYLICMDADLQHPAVLIPDFLKQAKENQSKLIIGARKKSLKVMPLHRIFSNIITSAIVSILTGQQIKDSQCGFRCIHRDVIKQLELSESGFQLESEMLLKAGRIGIKIDFLDIPTIYDNERSHIANISDTMRFIRLIFKEIGYKSTWIIRKKHS